MLEMDQNFQIANKMTMKILSTIIYDFPASEANSLNVFIVIILIINQTTMFVSRLMKT